MLAISDKVVIRADDLLNWFDDTVNWHYGLKATTIRNESNECDSIKKEPICDDEHKSDDTKVEMSHLSNVRSLKNSQLDFTDIEQEKGKFNFFLLFFSFISSEKIYFLF